MAQKKAAYKIYPSRTPSQKQTNDKGKFSSFPKPKQEDKVAQPLQTTSNTHNTKKTATTHAGTKNTTIGSFCTNPLIHLFQTMLSLPRLSPNKSSTTSNPALKTATRPPHEAHLHQLTHQTPNAELVYHCSKQGRAHRTKGSSKITAYCTYYPPSSKNISYRTPTRPTPRHVGIQPTVPTSTGTLQE